MIPKLTIGDAAVDKKDRILRQLLDMLPSEPIIVIDSHQGLAEEIQRRKDDLCRIIGAQTFLETAAIRFAIPCQHHWFRPEPEDFGIDRWEDEGGFVPQE